MNSQIHLLLNYFSYSESEVLFVQSLITLFVSCIGTAGLLLLTHYARRHKNPTYTEVHATRLALFLTTLGCTALLMVSADISSYWRKLTPQQFNAVLNSANPNVFYGSATCLKDGSLKIDGVYKGAHNGSTVLAPVSVISEIKGCQDGYYRVKTSRYLYKASTQFYEVAEANSNYIAKVGRDTGFVNLIKAPALKISDMTVQQLLENSDKLSEPRKVPLSTHCTAEMATLSPAQIQKQMPCQATS